MTEQKEKNVYEYVKEYRVDRGEEYTTIHKGGQEELFDAIGLRTPDWSQDLDQLSPDEIEAMRQQEKEYYDAQEMLSFVEEGAVLRLNGHRVKLLLSRRIAYHNTDNYTLKQVYTILD
jgi:uncharacterized Rmd1/YagE family protein